MKQVISTFAILFAILFCELNAQVSFGAKAGVNISSWSTNADDTKGKLGFHLGGVGEYELTDQIDLVGELLFSSQGVKDDDPDVNATSPFNYLSIPLTARYNFTEEVSAHAGLQPSILLSAKQKYDGGPDIDIKDEFSGADIAIIFGGQYAILEQVSAGLRVVLGLNDIAKDDFGEARNRIIQLYGVYLF